MLSKTNKLKIIKNGFPYLPDYLKKIIIDKYPKIQLGGNLNINSSFFEGQGWRNFLTPWEVF